MAYATPEQLRAYLGQVGEAADPLLSAILDRATDLVDGVLGFSFGDWGAPTGKDVRGLVSQYLELPRHQVGSVSGCMVVYAKATPAEGVTEATDYVELPDGRLYRDWGWQAGWYRVTAVWGYGPPPAAVVEVTLEVAVNLWRSKDRAAFTPALGAEGGGAFQGPDGLTGGQRYVLERVRRQVLGVVFA